MNTITEDLAAEMMTYEVVDPNEILEAMQRGFVLQQWTRTGTFELVDPDDGRRTWTVSPRRVQWLVEAGRINRDPYNLGSGKRGYTLS